ncbi:hypothetical protein QQX98_007636 [Neonectria punicea]|uniref:Palmitoyl-protein thioesterase 1 n=1 Tax=Neonectria punicea TaxID=979145 RepID=A0ABR1GXE1_9HYPO
MYPSSLLRLAVAATAALAAHSNAARTADDDDSDDTPLPLVIWHGLGDAFNADGMKQVGELADAIHPGTFVYTIALGADANSDRQATFFGNITEQLEGVCAALAAHPILSTAPAIDAIGFSQGGQFLRGYVERCNLPPIRSLVTFGSQHNGITKFRACGNNDWLCKGAMALLRFNTWSNMVQSRLIPAQYYRDPEDYDSYLQHSNFLADINNERELKNVQYKANLASLTNFVMYLFEDDTTAIPKESSWFEEVNGTEIIPLRARKLYQEDWIGLRELDRKGGLKFRSITGEHMQITEQALNDTMIDFFGPYKRTFAAEPAVVDSEPEWEEL